MSTTTLRERMLQVREEAILDTVNALLAQKGYDLMTVDEVAASAGVAKASLYKHFPSKEALACAAMVRVLHRAVQELQAHASRGVVRPIERLRETVRWALHTQYAGQMPSLPAQNSALRSVLTSDAEYMALLMDLSEQLGEQIEAARADGDLATTLPTDVVLFTLFARACDPVLGVLKATGQYDADRCVELVLQTCFQGLASRRGEPRRATMRTVARPAGTSARKRA